LGLRNIRVDGDDILRKVSKPVVEVDNRTRALVDDMLETMYHVGGVGIAAVQVGILKRVLAIDISEEKNKPIIVINPVVLHNEGSQTGEEGCLSVPGFRGTVTRPMVTNVRGLDRDGNEIELNCEGFLAVVINHELDHLNGILYTDNALEVWEAKPDDAPDSEDKEE
jgi:peptide deformylase